MDIQCWMLVFPSRRGREGDQEEEQSGEAPFERRWWCDSWPDRVECAPEEI